MRGLILSGCALAAAPSAGSQPPPVFGVERSPRLAEEGQARRALLCLGMLVRDEEALLRAHLPL